MDGGGGRDCRVLGADGVVLLLRESKGCEEGEEGGTEECVFGGRSASQRSVGREEGTEAEGVVGEEERIEHSKHVEMSKS